MAIRTEAQVVFYIHSTVSGAITILGARLKYILAHVKYKNMDVMRTNALKNDHKDFWKSK